MYAVTTIRASATPKKFEVTCSGCNMRELCLTQGMQPDDMRLFENVVYARRRIKRGEALFGAGDEFKSVYAVRSGFFKTRMSSEDGREQVSGFQMAGELLGLDGISTDQHSCDAVALEDSQVCVIPFEQLEQLSREFSDLQRQFHKIMSREIVRDQGVMLLLGNMRAEERLAAFLLNLTQRLQARGFSATAVSLRMSREEIASFLGLTLGTISRSFSKLQDQGLLFVRNRQIQITDPLGLQQLLDGAP